MSKPFDSLTVFGIRFLDETVQRCVEIVREGGLLVVPSGPGLAQIDRDRDYLDAVQGADFAIADSGFMVLLLRLLRRAAPRRISGLLFIRALLDDPAFRNERAFWVSPRPSERELTRQHLAAQGFETHDDDFYVAPMYPYGGPIADPELLARIEAARPGWVILAVAGGKQEKLGHYLRRHLSYRPAIVCIGAAIAFENGAQTAIPPWADRLMLGWLLRILSNPRVYLKRYWEALRLLRVMLTYPKPVSA